MSVAGTQRAGLSSTAASLFVPLSVTSTGNTLSLTNGSATLQFNSSGLTTNRRVTMNYGSIINQTNSVGVDDNILLLQTDGVYKANIDRYGNFTATGQSIRAGNGENNEKFLVMWNSARYVYFYNQASTGEVGLYDGGTGPGTVIGGDIVAPAMVRWKSDASGNFTVAGQLSTGDITTFRSYAPTTGVVYFGNSGTKYLYYDGGQFVLTDTLNVNSGGITSSALDRASGGQIRLTIGTAPGAILRNDGTNTYLLFSNNGDPNGDFNSLRPFYVNNTTGLVGMNNNLYVSDIFRQGDWNTDAGSGKFLAAYHSIYMNNLDRDGLSIRSTVVRNDTAVSNNNMINLWATQADGGRIANAITFITGGGTDAGTITISDNITSYNSVSDYRVKTNVTTLTNALDFVNSVPAVSYDFINAPRSWKVFGFLAHEVDEQIKGVVIGEKDLVDSQGKPILQTIDNSKLVPVAWNALRELHQLVKDQQEVISTLQAQVNALSAQP